MQSAAKCRREQVTISLTSLRGRDLSDAMIAIMAGIRRTGAPWPGAATQRLASDQQASANRMSSPRGTPVRPGLQQVNLYFMIGLPTENRAVIQGIFDLCRKVLDTARPVNKPQVTAAVSPFVPKTHTPSSGNARLQGETAEKLAFLRYLFYRQETGHALARTAMSGWKACSRAATPLAPAVLRAYRAARFCDW